MSAAALDALAGDRRRGAAEIATGLLDWGEAWGEDETGDGAGSDEAAAALARLARSQAVLAPVLRIANDFLLELERREGADTDAARRAVARSAGAWRGRLAAAKEALALHVRRAVGGASTIYTYSASSTVRNAIEAHYSAGNWFRLVVSEARPGNEGAALARRLAERGVPVRLGTDVWLWSALEEGEGVLVVGADALMSARWVNKIGTAALAERARAVGVEVVVAADTSKWLPPALAALPRTYERDPGEIALRPPASLEVTNPCFEEIEYEKIDHLVTERGPTRPRDLRSGEIPVAGLLR